MEIHAATISDCSALARAMEVVVGEGRWLATEPSTSVDQLAGRFRRAIEANHLLFVLAEGTELLGAIGMHPTEAEGVSSIGMWILPQWRGQGGGRRLVQAALDARPAAVHKVELEVFPDNAAAIALYRSMGFEREGLRRDHYRRLDGSLRSALIMARLFSS
jgi:RimJ/RimL family protein N-acetyltransferase